MVTDASNKQGDRCSANVPYGGRSVRFHRCHSKAAPECIHNGKPYCRRHYPPTVAEKNEKQHEAWRRQSNLDAKIRDLETEIREDEAALVHWAIYAQPAFTEVKRLMANRDRLKELKAEKEAL